MLRFYTLSDSRKSFFRLFQIESVADYIASISNMSINLDLIKGAASVHADYDYCQNYISKLIKDAPRVCFLGVYDFQKEAFFINKFPDKQFVVGDVSSKALNALKHEYANVDVIETTLDEFIPNDEDLIIINLAEYFLTKDQMISFVNKGRGVVMNTWFPLACLFLCSYIKSNNCKCCFDYYQTEAISIQRVDEKYWGLHEGG